MGFESVRGYLELASGLGDLTKARAKDAAQGLLSLPVAGITTGTKMASQASALADELLAAATANRSNLTTLVRSEVDIAITRLGLVSVQKLEEARAEAAGLRAEVARLRVSSAAAPAASASKVPVSKVKRKAAVAQSTAKRSAAPKSTAKKSAPPKSTAKKAVSKAAATPAKATRAGRSAVSTRAKPARP